LALGPITDKNDIFKLIIGTLKKTMKVKKKYYSKSKFFITNIVSYHFIHEWLKKINYLMSYSLITSTRMITETEIS